MTKVITVAIRKGGAGKTNTSMMLATTLFERGYSVIIGDVDKDQNAFHWIAAADEPLDIEVVNLSERGRGVSAWVKKQRGKYDFVILDCPPKSFELETASAIASSDLVLVPYVPSRQDIDAIEELMVLIESAQAVNPSLQAYQLPSRYSDSKTARDLVASAGGLLPELGVTIHERPAYLRACAIGTGVIQLKGADKSGNGEAIKEVNQLTDLVLERLK